MTTPSNLDQKLVKLGISELKSVRHVEALQKDMLRLLRGSSVDPISYAGLEYCGPEYCGRVGCSEACAFGARRRRRNDIPKIVRLLEQRGGPFHELRVYWRRWDRRFGALANISIAEAKQFLHSALDGLLDPTLVAVGTFKFALDYDDFRWKCEIHLIVAGVKKSNLLTQFAARVQVRAVGQLELM